MSWDLFEGNWNHTKEKVRGKWSMPFVTAAISLNQLLSSATALPPIMCAKRSMIGVVGRIGALHEDPPRCRNGSRRVRRKKYTPRLGQLIL
jgi:hypothetical protein